jgi:hypothetical protein
LPYPKYTGAPGSVIASASSVSRSGNHVFGLPLKDPRGGLSSTGGYPWFIDEKGSTVVFIKNSTEAPQQFHLDVIFPGGQWGSNLKTLAPGQTFKLDVREVRDSQAKGSEGNAIPLDATRGHVYWSAFGTGEKVLIGRAQTVDLDHGMASTYECQCPCPSSFANARMTPSSVIGYPGYSAFLQAEQQNRNCLGTMGSWFAPSGVTFSSANPSIATIDSGGFMTAIAPGSTNLNASWTGIVHFSAGHSGCSSQNVNANPGASCEVKPFCEGKPLCTACESGGKACGGSGQCKTGKDLIPQICNQLGITYANQRTPSCSGGRCGVVIEYDITRVTHSCDSVSLGGEGPWTWVTN